MVEIEGITGRTVLITGAGGPNMGRAAAVLFAAHGARVVVTDVQGPALQETAAQVGLVGGDVIAETADVQDEDAVGRLVERACAAFGTVHHLLNFAALHRPREGTLTCTASDWDRIVGVTLKGTWLVSKHAMSVMRENAPIGPRGWRGTVVTVASAVAQRGAPSFVAYTAAKAGVVGLTRAMASDGAPLGIRVNCISPGLTRTPATPLPAGSDAERGAVARLHLLPYLCEPEDQAQAALWLCSDAARCLTGGVLAVDCGWTARE